LNLGSLDIIELRIVMTGFEKIYRTIEKIFCTARHNTSRRKVKYNFIGAL